MNDLAQVGIVLQQHYNNPQRLGQENLKCLLNIDLNRLDFVIFDIKDISGRLFLDTTPLNLGNIVVYDYFPYIHQILELCKDYNIIIYLGIPCFHDETIKYANVMFADGTIFKGRICPSSSCYLDKFIKFLNNIEQTYTNYRFFLPFFRYPPASKGFSCFCDSCRNKWMKCYGYDAVYKNIIGDFRQNMQWHQFKCNNMEVFLATVRAKIKSYLAVEVDVDPVKDYGEGLYINDGQDIELLSKHVDEYIIHFYDKSGHKIFRESIWRNNGMDASFPIFFYLQKLQKKYSLFYWSNDNLDKSYIEKYRFANYIGAQTAFFLVNSNQTGCINKLLDWRSKNEK